MVVLVPVAAAAAEARAGHAATPPDAAEGLHVTLPGAPAPALAPAPRFILPKAMVCLGAGEETFTSFTKSCILNTDHLMCLHCLVCFLFPPLFVAVLFF